MSTPQAVLLEMRELASAIHADAQVIRLSQPGTFDRAMLAARYNGMSVDKVLVLLATHCGYKRRKGSVAVPAHLVLKLDDLLASCGGVP